MDYSVNLNLGRIKRFRIYTRTGRYPLFLKKKTANLKNAKISKFMTLDPRGHTQFKQTGP